MANQKETAGKRVTNESTQDVSSNGNSIIAMNGFIAINSTIKGVRLDFHPVRKPFNGFSNGGSELDMETLNPCFAEPSTKSFVLNRPSL
ncbi:hypothetical protein DY000_02050248 [Brassica cretica]|uniref:Uncharacterized protein n=1 Tax=Brassica cretica TaxID=69181 RepID=A0ABQ7F004_BRACR|nr:hypothetical protein DY000_02050248 [Brassica cretica]